MMKKIVFYTMMLAFLALGFLTLIPDSSATKVCYLGYKAHCSFTPFGTMILFVAAIITFLLAKKATKREKA